MVRLVDHDDVERRRTLPKLVQEHLSGCKRHGDDQLRLLGEDVHGRVLPPAAHEVSAVLEYVELKAELEPEFALPALGLRCRSRDYQHATGLMPLCQPPQDK